MASFLWRAGRALISPVTAELTRRAAFSTPNFTLAVRYWLSTAVNPVTCLPRITNSRFLPLVESSSLNEDASKALVLDKFQILRFYSDKCGKKPDKCGKKPDKCKKKKDKCKKKKDKCKKKKDKCKKKKKPKKCKKSKKKKCKSKKRKSKKCKRTKKPRKGKKKKTKCKQAPRKYEKPKRPCDVDIDIDMSADGKRDECDLENEDPCERQRKIDKNPCVKRSKRKGKKCGTDICRKLKPKGKGKKGKC